MGMSSSQARLLTLTARMHDIEYRAQRLEAQKLQMANESRRAYEDYLNELDRTKLEAKVLGQDGSMTAIPFTADAVYTYKQLTSQYALKTADGKALIPQEYHNAYQTNDTLSDYLNSFGVCSTVTSTERTETPNPAYQELVSDYERRMAEWEIEHNRYLQRHSDWENFEGEFPRSRYLTSLTYSGEYNQIISSCRNHVINGDKPYCFSHVFLYLIGFNNPEHGGAFDANDTYDWVKDSYSNSYNTTVNDGTGNPLSITLSTVLFENTGFYHQLKVDPNKESKFALLHEISNAVHDEVQYKAADGRSDDHPTESSSVYEKLMSQYNIDGSAKSLLQWAIDMYYVMSKYDVDTGVADVDGYPGLTQFKADMRSILNIFDERMDSVKKFDQERYEADEPRFNTPEPEFDDLGIEEYFIEEETTEHTVITDRNYAQWLINIWYKMEGQDEVPQIVEETLRNGDETFKVYTIDNKSKTNPQAEGTNKYTNEYENENYIMIPQDKLNDPEWVKNTILEGWVLIQKFDKEGSKFNDTSVAVDTHLQEVADEKNLKKAEAKYEANMRRIDQKDRRYDTQLAALDTERNAIKLEMETVKTVARDNVDRTFKLFS